MQMVANHFHDMYIYSKVTMTCTYIPRLLNFQGFLHSKVTTFPRLPLQHSNQDADPIKMPFRYMHTYVCMTCRYTHILCISCVLYSFCWRSMHGNQYGSPVWWHPLLLRNFKYKNMFICIQKTKTHIYIYVLMYHCALSYF